MNTTEYGKYRFTIRQDGQTVVTAIGHGVPLDVIPASNKLPHEVVSDWMDEWA